MILTAYSQANDRGELHVWVGMLGDAFPGGAPLPAFNVDGQVLKHISGSMKLVKATGQDWTGRFVLQPPAPRPEYKVEVLAGGQSVVFTSKRLPNDLPAQMDGEFRVLLCSCYSQPEDSADLEDILVRRLQLRPDMSIMAGDQVYLDLPISPLRSQARLQSDLRSKYIANWTSVASGARGIMEVLQLAPVMTVPDDHEYWNNYPYFQALLPDTVGQRSTWTDTARGLYESFQLCESSRNGAIRLSVGPLRFLCIDMRSDRDSDAKQLMSDATWKEFDAWIKELKDTPGTVGVMSSGQALLVKRRSPLLFNAGDAEMPNYEQFDRLVAGLDDLASNGVPVVYLTGDVHWGRVAKALHENRPMLYEVISSPSTQIHIPGVDGAKKIFQGVKKLFGADPQPWPLHADADEVPDRFGPAGRFSPHTLKKSVRGNQVAMVGFRRRGTGVEFTVTYYFVSPDQALNPPVVCGPYSLNRQ